MGSEFPLVDVVGIGLNAADTVIRLPHFPAFDSKVEFTSTGIYAGGQVASAMVACQSWGLRTRYVGKVGDDQAAEFQRHELARAGVEAHLLAVPGCTSQVAFILVDQTGERTILWKRDKRLELRPEEIDRNWVLRARMLLVDGHDTASAATAARWARAAGLWVTADLDNLYPGVEALLENVDYLIASRNFPDRLFGKASFVESLPRIRMRYGCQVVGVTLGREGALAWDGTRFYYSPAYAVAAVDTTGAGDIFHGAFVYALLQGWPLQRQLDFSCAAAGLNCTAFGARGGIRPLPEIEHLMHEDHRHVSAFDRDELERYVSPRAKRRST